VAVVGPNLYNPNKSKTPVQGQTNQQMSLEEINAFVQKTGIPVTINVGTAGAQTPNYNVGLLESLSREQLSIIARMLKKMGYTVKANPGSIKNLFMTEPELEAIVGNVTSRGGTGSTLINELSSMYIPIGSSEEPNLPTRTITEQDPKVLGDIVDKVYLAQGKRRATAEEKQKIINDIQEDIRQGTLTTTKKVKNPKTGKMENVTTVKSAFSQSKFEAGLEENFQKLNPKDFDLAKRIDFNKWLFDNMPSDGGI
jgi:hypothetical protein